jgi:hypothetical protein
MSQIMYNYPAMLAHAGDMSGYAGTLQGLGADIAGEQAVVVVVSGIVPNLNCFDWRCGPRDDAC